MPHMGRNTVSYSAPDHVRMHNLSTTLDHIHEKQDSTSAYRD